MVSQAHNQGRKRSSQAASNAYLPKTVTFRIRDPHLTWDIEWNGSRFIVRTGFMGSETQEHRPSSEEWEEFWRSIEAIGVWKWKEQYIQKKYGVIDGIGWELRIEFRGRTVTSTGDNAYPGAQEAEPSEPFLQLIRAFEKLTHSRHKWVGP